MERWTLLLVASAFVIGVCGQSHRYEIEHDKVESRMKQLRDKISTWKTLKKQQETAGTFKIDDNRGMMTDFHTLAHLAHQNGDIAEAASIAEEAIELWDDSSRFASLLGDARMAQGKCEQAIQAYKDGAEDSDRYQNEHWISLVLAYYRCGKRDDAHNLSAKYPTPHILP